MNRQPQTRRRTTRARTCMHRERGASLVELLVGITVGLLVVLAAVGTVIYTSTTAAAVTDTVRLNLQAQSVFETLALHLRQSASHTMADSGVGDPGLGGAITFQSGLATNTNAVSLSADGGLVLRHGTNLAAAVPVFAPSAELRSCLGSRPAGRTLSVNAFVFDDDNSSNPNGNLTCDDEIAGAQAIAENAEAFTTRFGLRNATTNTLQYVPGASMAAADWSRVESIEVCLQLRGDKRNNIQSIAINNNCQGTNTSATDGRLHRVFRRVFTVRPRLS